MAQRLKAIKNKPKYTMKADAAIASLKKGIMPKNLKIVESESYINKWNVNQIQPPQPLYTKTVMATEQTACSYFPRMK